MLDRPYPGGSRPDRFPGDRFRTFVGVGSPFSWLDCDVTERGSMDARSRQPSMDVSTLHVPGARQAPGKEHSVKRTLLVGAVCAVTVAALAQPASSAPTQALSAQAIATRAADSFVGAPPATLMAGAGEQFVQLGTINSDGLQYVSYARTYQGLPVIGGDFVVVADGVGKVQDLS